MAIAPRLDLRQTQSLVMTPQLQQAIKLLQFSNLEVAAFVEEELERNPLLERDERPGEDFGGVERPALDQVTPLPAEAEAAANGLAEAPEPRDAAEPLRSGELVEATEPLDVGHAEPYDPGGAGDGVPARRGDADGEGRTIDEYAAGRTTLRESVELQIRLTFGDPVDRMLAAQLLAQLDPTGRLAVTPEILAAALGVAPERLEAVRARMMRLEPVGMFARDLRECLAVQLADRNRLDPAMQALLDNLPLLAARDYRELLARCEVDAADLADMIAELRRLDPKPGAAYDEDPPPAIVPDVLMRRGADGAWLLELNSETLPRVLVNQSFTARVQVGASREARAFVADKLQTANWLVKSLQQRGQTILKVAAEIVRQQEAFFLHGVGHLRPLILRDVAEAVEMHESTVSRVTASKYIGTPRGTFELKYFFTTAISGTGGGETHSAEAVRWRIRSMIAAEPADAILSDDAIVAALRDSGIDIARRTVAKYREALRIPSSVQRKKEKAEAL
jgi:RNA polymerase sigma-54 factor